MRYSYKFVEFFWRLHFATLFCDSSQLASEHFAHSTLTFECSAVFSLMSCRLNPFRKLLRVRVYLSCFISIHLGRYPPSGMNLQHPTGAAWGRDSVCYCCVNLPWQSEPCKLLYSPEGVCLRCIIPSVKFVFDKHTNGIAFIPNYVNPNEKSHAFAILSSNFITYRFSELL